MSEKTTVYGMTIEDAQKNMLKLIDMIKGTFEWSSSKQGTNYWENVKDNLMEIYTNMELATTTVKVNLSTYYDLDKLASKLNYKTYDEVIGYVLKYYLDEH